MTDSYIIAEGDLSICLVAHLDTVFNIPPKDIYYDEQQQVMWSPQGLGADDRAGVYAILKIIEDGFKPTIIFTTDEELGGLGAEDLILDFPKCPFKGIKIILELDRSGEKDCVFYYCKNTRFEKYIQSYGFEYAEGTFSDISFIAPTWGIAAVNLSVGYLNEHSPLEILHTDWLNQTIERIKMILKKINEMPAFKYHARRKNTFDFF